MSAVSLLLAGEPATHDTRSTRVSIQLRALLDDLHLTQLVEGTSHLHYEADFQVAGNELGIEPSTVLCEACRELTRNPPEAWLRYNTSPEEITSRSGPSYNLAPPRREAWALFHRSIFELISCVYSARGKCHICHLFWHACRRKARLRRHEGRRLRIEWQETALEVALLDRAHSQKHSLFHLYLSIPEVRPWVYGPANPSIYIQVARGKYFGIAGSRMG